MTNASTRAAEALSTVPGLVSLQSHTHCLFPRGHRKNGAVPPYLLAGASLALLVTPGHALAAGIWADIFGTLLLWLLGLVGYLVLVYKLASSSRAAAAAVFLVHIAAGVAYFVSSHEGEWQPELGRDAAVKAYAALCKTRELKVHARVRAQPGDGILLTNAREGEPLYRAWLDSSDLLFRIRMSQPACPAARPGFLYGKFRGRKDFGEPEEILGRYKICKYEAGEAADLAQARYELRVGEELKALDLPGSNWMGATASVRLVDRQSQAVLAEDTLFSNAPSEVAGKECMAPDALAARMVQEVFRE